MGRHVESAASTDVYLHRATVSAVGGMGTIEGAHTQEPVPSIPSRRRSTIRGRISRRHHFQPELRDWPVRSSRRIGSPGRAAVHYLPWSTCIQSGHGSVGLCNVQTRRISVPKTSIIERRKDGCTATPHRWGGSPDPSVRCGLNATPAKDKKYNVPDTGSSRKPFCWLTHHHQCSCGERVVDS